MRTAAAASWQPKLDTRPEVQPAPEVVAQQRRVDKLALQEHVSEGVTPAYLRSREKALLRELAPIENELKAVRSRLAALTTPI